MNNSPIPKALLVILLVIALGSCWYCLAYRSRINQLRRLQADISTVNFMQQRFSMLVNEANNYSKKNPAMEPILRSLSGPAPSTPAAKPSSK